MGRSSVSIGSSLLVERESDLQRSGQPPSPFPVHYLLFLPLSFCSPSSTSRELRKKKASAFCFALFYTLAVEMDLLPETVTIRQQRDVELSLLNFLRKYEPEVYRLWRHHPDYSDADSDDYEDLSSPSSSSAAADAPHHDDGEASDAAPPTAFHRRRHMDYVRKQIGVLPGHLQGLYPAQTWLVYWALQAADVLGVTEELYQVAPQAAIAHFLLSCLKEDVAPLSESTSAAGEAADAADASTTERNASPMAFSPPSGLTPFPLAARASSSHASIGFASGPLAQLPHLVASYAALSALCILGESRYVAQLPRLAMKRWLLELRNEDGSFKVHRGGESDIRASYCAAVLASLLRLDEVDTFPIDGDLDAEAAAEVMRIRQTPLMTPLTARYVASCQTHEGGFACGDHAAEAHGAYTQCGLAALLLMKQPHLCDLSSLRRWLAARQLKFEGGFNGRTNKLVDSCYSHWVGTAHVLLRVCESYARLLGTQSGAHPQETSSSASSASQSTCLRAREVMLLDHAQLIDATMILAQDDEQWKHVEAEHRAAEAQVDAFLGVEDAASEAPLLSLDRFLSFNHPNSSSTKKRVEEEKEAHKDSNRLSFPYEPVGDYFFNQRKLQQYVFRCCQEVGVGGLMDKPGCPNDSYHTCYSLSGVSSAQNLQYVAHALRAASATYLATAFDAGYVPRKTEGDGGYGVVLGIESPSPASAVAVLRSTNPILNIHRSRVVSTLSTKGLRTFL